MFATSGPEIPKKSQKGVPGPPGPECQQSVEKVPNDRTEVKKTTKSVFGEFFDTFLTLRAGRPGKSFLRLFGNFGARGCGDSCICGLPSQSYVHYSLSKYPPPPEKIPKIIRPEYSYVILGGGYCKIT